MLCTALLTILSGSSVYAADPVPPAAPATPAAPKVVTPAPTTTTPAPTPVPAPEPVKSSSVPAPLPEPVINCKYHIPAETSTIQQSVISTWAGKAAVQSFEFNPATIDEELVDLKSCYTDQGWQGFNDALKKSGNIDAIKAQHLSVSSQVDGEVKITVVKDNQWKVNVPIQVVYQNDKEKLTQQLGIDLLIGRKISGDLGIMQMIASPRQTNAPAAQLPATTPGPVEPTATPGSTTPVQTPQP
jgi:hypothetical protein